MYKKQLAIAPILSAIILFAPVCFAAGGSPDATFSGNGAIVGALEPELQKYLMKTEMQQIGFGVYQQPMNYDAGTTASQTTTNPPSPKQDFASRHVVAHCSPMLAAEKNGLGCMGVALNPAQAAEAQYFEMGDVKTSVLLDPTLYTPGVFIMAQTYIRNVVNPFPDAKIKALVSKLKPRADGSGPNPADQAKYADYLAKQALLNVSLYSLNEMYGMRAPGASMAQNSSLPDNAKTTSVLKVMEDETTRRFVKPDFEALLNNANTDQLAVLKEIARMQAVSLWMQYMSYRQNERMEAIMAAQLAQAVNPRR